MRSSEEALVSSMSNLSGDSFVSEQSFKIKPLKERFQRFRNEKIRLTEELSGLFKCGR